jgi:hypothetical protein
MIPEAVRMNGNSMSNTMNTGVSHDRITDASVSVLEAIDAYQWDCTPGRWLLYTLRVLLALPFPAWQTRKLQVVTRRERVKGDGAVER